MKHNLHADDLKIKLDFDFIKQTQYNSQVNSPVSDMDGQINKHP